LLRGLPQEWVRAVRLEALLPAPPHSSALDSNKNLDSAKQSSSPPDFFPKQTQQHAQ
jgi:hypothetical protein